MFLSCCFICDQSFTLTAGGMVTSPNAPSSPREYLYRTPSVPAAEIKKGGAHEQGATTSTPTDETDDKGQMPAWMLESARSAKEYVENLDKGNYPQSWTQGDQLFQHTISQQEWTQALNSSRKGLGRMNSRTIRLQRPAWNPKGLPPGPYMVIEYDTAFENSPQSLELLTLRRGTDGKWRVLTYQVN
jgi:hypothetical protein